jgi:hypothetical protein
MFPIYWVPQRVGSVNQARLVWSWDVEVSNLLGSPASGERGRHPQPGAGRVSSVSNLLGSPASGEE